MRRQKSMWVRYIYSGLLVFSTISTAPVLMVLAAESASKEEKTGPIVMNLHHSNPYFAGRDDYFSEITHKFETPEAIVALSGMAGVGKSQIAHRFAEAHAGNYEILWWIDAKKNIPEQYRQFARTLDRWVGEAGGGPRIVIEDTPLPDLVLQINQILRAKRLNHLIIFDNVQQLEDVTPFFPQEALGADVRIKSHILLTTRNPLLWNQNMLAVNQFSRAESIAYIRKRMPTLSAEDTTLLAQSTYDYPVLLSQAVPYLLLKTEMSVREYCAILQKNRGAQWKAELDLQRLTQQDVSIDKYQQTLQSAITMTVETMRKQSKDAGKILASIAVLHNHGIPADVLGGVLDGKLANMGREERIRRVEPLLLELVERGILLRKEQRAGGGEHLYYS